ncbi:MAG: glycosyltransferase family 2 protein [Rhodospirillales bacterium]|jgi:glycosyltransferase involved in cell wall biosynthesis|nr:glycosyltransferase family 2 protein [Rhodospirillales bacterium]MDP6882675.1 glycosyltransferase family 2 protein [Rhodospirillales bacterium]
MTPAAPRITIVTPSLNQGAFLDAALRSVGDQDYPDLEHIVIDGGSTDGSVEIIGAHADHLAWSVSEPDGGQYHALNKGFARATGEVMGWLNADDAHLPWTLALVGEIFRQLPEVEWLTTLAPLICNEDGLPIRCRRRAPFSRRAFLAGDNLPGQGWHAQGWIQQEATFWRRSLWERVGGRLDESLSLAGDFDLWARFFAEAEPHATEVPLARFRRHAGQRTAAGASEYHAEALAALARHGGRHPSRPAAAMRLALRRTLPTRLKPLAFRFGLVAPGKVCVFDLDRGLWGVSEE